jgi:hypothetical protein
MELEAGFPANCTVTCLIPHIPSSAYASGISLFPKKNWK